MGRVVETLGRITCKNWEKSLHAVDKMGGGEGYRLESNIVEITGANFEAANAQGCLLAPAPCGLGSNASIYAAVTETMSLLGCYKHA